MKGKKILVMGVLNNYSIAWHIAKSLKESGVDTIILTYQNATLESRVKALALELSEESVIKVLTIECDVSSDVSLERAFSTLADKCKKIDGLVHAIAFSDKDELKGRYLDTTRANFLNTMDVSCYSLVAAVKYAEPLLNDGSSILTLSYYGAEKVITNYNVMGIAKAGLEASVRYLAVDLGVRGIRVNAISAGPMRTLASSGISGFKAMLVWNEKNAPLKRNIDGIDVGNSAVYLLSDMSRSVTGEILHVDCGYNIIGTPLEL